MRYIAVIWKHQDPAYPTALYSELDGAGWEHRKVEVFADGRIGYADRSGASGGTRLSIEPLPPVAEIATDPQFEPREIAGEEFERMWAGRGVP
jgi:hypothetical protein